MKLAEALKIVQGNSSANGEKFSVYLACGIFPLHLTSFLTAQLSLRLPERRIEVQTGLYGDLMGNLAQVQKASVQGAAVVIEWSDLDPRLGLRRLGGWGPKVLPDVQASVERTANQLRQLLAAAAESTELAVCLPTLPLPPIFYQPGAEFGAENLLLEKTLYDFALSLAEIPHVRIVGRQQLDTVSPTAERLDVKSELSTGFPYRTAHASAVAELLADLLQPRPAKKGLITDLDDTLWRGLVGEVGSDCVSWDLDNRSHIHALYQQLLRSLSESGVLIAVASKNDPAVAKEALARPDLLLFAERLFPVEVSWNPKSQSVGTILEAWNVSADAVVFVDDSALELAEVNSAFPAIECLRFPRDDEQAAYALLEKLRDLFGKQSILKEDSIRMESLRARREFHQQRQIEPAKPLENFLAQVEAELTLSRVPAAGEPRALELVNKTNQFNLNARRLTDTEFQAALNRPGAISLLVSYRDKYGPLGKIAVVLGQVESSILKIDTWVMSCRAFSRYIEHQCLEHLFESHDVSEIELNFRPTERNGPVRDFLSLFADMTQDPIRIERKTFMSRKPKLSHKINEVTYA